MDMAIRGQVAIWRVRSSAIWQNINRFVHLGKILNDSVLFATAIRAGMRGSCGGERDNRNVANGAAVHDPGGRRNARNAAHRLRA